MNGPKFYNAEVAKLLGKMAIALTALDDDAFRIRAYQNASNSISNLSSEIRDLWDSGELESIPGIGKTLATYLDEYFRTGAVKHFDETFKKLPEGMFDLSGLPEVGPKTAFRLSKELGIKTAKELEKAAKSHKIAELPGFGLESEKDILDGLERKKAVEIRHLLPRALEIASNYIEYLRQSEYVKDAEALGSIRRHAATVGDIDIAVATENSVEVVNHFIKYPGISKVVSFGDKKATVLVHGGEQIDLMTQVPIGFGSLLQHFTGSKNHNIVLRELAKEKGLSLSEYGIKKEGKIMQFENETKFYNYLGLDFIPPELRENRGEIEAAGRHELPNLIILEDIKGDLHNHTDFIEGENTLEEMIAAVRQAGYQYYAYCDHAPSIERRGLFEVKKIIAERRAYVDKFNKQSADLKLFLGFEININANGQLAWPNELLSQLDFVVASIHTNLKDPIDKMTKRLLSAIQNPYVTIIGHPSNRLLLEREASLVNWEEVFKAASRSGKIMEINAHPLRLDLSDELILSARRLGVKFLISSDAHSTTGLSVLPYGVWTARRGWLGAEDVVNTLDYEKLRALFGKIRVV